MITLYTAVGRFELQTNQKGEQVPVVTTHKGEHILNIQEMIIWSSLLWNYMTMEELQPVFYYKEREAHVLGDMNCEDYVERLILRGLIVSGRDYKGDDALFKLVSNLHIMPVTSRLSTKLAAFAKLTLLDCMPIRKALTIFKTDNLTPDEKAVVNLISQEQLTTAELVMCIDKNVFSLNNYDTLVNTLYNDEQTTCYNIAVAARFCGKLQLVLQTTANLYLRKLIVFEKIL